MITRTPDRFTIDVDGANAGHTAYRDRAGDRIFHHTEIGGEFGGRGLAGQLVEAAVRETAEAGRTVVAVCPYVLTWLTENDPSGVTWRKPTPADLTWLKKELA
ncbi:GNAT family N-acetyltransferase [Corynebacterium marinum]|uniref:N-acetyltransferase domain-containing protein n=1 Tax=Corynebacterium marinum DSM 44953 TaxID=1224162 RepID=A0A0B6TTC1_9CORY|nr:GNAT family N-acetyltransferase [Corynebacterium marinum]AJK69499.1 hypothetical protein B840_09540 [Corynebacterium marinum DSM 44953]GGO20755.1 N-acetyltransferase [Corynebacterium marinum]